METLKGLLFIIAIIYLIHWVRNRNYREPDSDYDTHSVQRIYGGFYNALNQNQINFSGINEAQVSYKPPEGINKIRVSIKSNLPIDVKVNYNYMPHLKQNLSYDNNILNPFELSNLSNYQNFFNALNQRDLLYGNLNCNQFKANSNDIPDYYETPRGAGIINL